MVGGSQSRYGLETKWLSEGLVAIRLSNLVVVVMVMLIVMVLVVRKVMVVVVVVVMVVLILMDIAGSLGVSKITS